MSRLFQAYVTVDWSAAAKPTTGPDSIWIGVLKRNVRFQLAFESHNPATRAEAETLLQSIFGELQRKSERALVGVDFPLGFPRGTAKALKLDGAPWRSMFEFIAHEVKDKPTNANNRFQVGAKMNRLMTGEAFPFWGAPARDAQTTLSTKRPREHREGDLPEFRHADIAAKGASSIWKLYFQGSVGGQALMGMPVIQRIQKQRGDGVRLWPFETGWRALSAEDLDGVEALVCEVYPSLWPVTPQLGQTKDEAQVRAVCERFAGLDEKGKLGALFGPKGEDVRRADIENEEGWILGAAF